MKSKNYVYDFDQKQAKSFSEFSNHATSCKSYSACCQLCSLYLDHAKEDIITLKEVTPTTNFPFQLIKSLTVIQLFSDLQGPGPRSLSLGEGGVTVSEVRRGPQSGSVLGTGGQVDHALSHLSHTAIRLLGVILGKNQKQKIWFTSYSHALHKAVIQHKHRMPTRCDKFLAAGHPGGPGPDVLRVEARHGDTHHTWGPVSGAGGGRGP